MKFHDSITDPFASETGLIESLKFDRSHEYDEYDYWLSYEHFFQIDARMQV